VAELVLVRPIKGSGSQKVTGRSLDSQPEQQTRQAPPVVRALRILLGLALMVYVTPVNFQVPMRVAVGSLLLVLGLVGIYSLIHVVVSRRIVVFGRCFGAIVGATLLVALYVAGGPGSLMLGHGEGRLAAVTFFGVSLVIAGVRAFPGCELMAIPGLLFGKHSELACLIFSPLDSLERKLRSKQ
jgi:peptidoglycan/LPS O-acetylase OafA/YrhL